VDQSVLRDMKERPAEYEDWTDAELMEEARSLHTSIFVMECFGSRDSLRYEKACWLLGERGYTIQEQRGITFVKQDQEG
jgi:hypothetical protein